MKKVIISNEAPAAIGPYSHAILTDNIAFLSGQIPLDPSTGKLVEGGIEEQTVQVLKNISAILNTAGLTFDNVIKTTVFLSDLANFKTVNEIYGKYFTSDCPARSCVQVAALPMGSLVEIGVICARE